MHAHTFFASEAAFGLQFEGLHIPIRIANTESLNFSCIYMLPPT